MNQRFVEQTYYEILEVPQDAPQHVIHEAYQRAKATYSPDSPALYTVFTAEEARELLELIDEAFHVLSNQATRKDYDRKLSSENEPPEQEPPPSQKASQPQASGKENSYQSANTIPEGFIKTKFGVYEVKPEMEELIETEENIDGDFLQRVRLYKNINLDQLSSETKIGRHHLKAIEANAYENLPAPVFTRGFIVQVARVLGVPDQRAANSYMELYKNQRS